MSADPVDWGVAEQVAVRLAEKKAPQVDESTRRALFEDFALYTAVAEELVVEHTGLRSGEGAARAEVIDRAGWVRANIASFRRLLSPLFERDDPKEKRWGFLTASLPEPFGKAARAAAGAELGALLGWMSTRVLGQYDLLLTEDAKSEGGVVYYVGPNIVSLENRHNFPADEFRLWIAIHELTHRAQFTGVPWMREHWLGLVNEGIAMASPDGKALKAALARTAADIRAGRNPLQESGLIGVLATPEQQAVLSRIQALMSLLEGHGDIIMNRAAAGRIPGARRFANTMQARRDSSRGVARLVQQLIGFEAKMRQYKEGEDFVRAVESAGGAALFARVWEEPDNLPSLEEVRDPKGWIDRVGGRSLEIA